MTHLRLGYRSGGCVECYPPTDEACIGDPGHLYHSHDDDPDPEPDYDAGDVPAGACWCHDAAPCPDVLAAADRDPSDPYRDRT